MLEVVIILCVVIVLLFIKMSHLKTILKDEERLSAIKSKKMYMLNKDIIFLLQSSISITKLLEHATADNENVDVSGMKKTYTEMLIRAQSIGESSFTTLYLDACKILKEEPEQV